MAAFAGIHQRRQRRCPLFVFLTNSPFSARPVEIHNAWTSSVAIVLPATLSSCCCRTTGPGIWRQVISMLANHAVGKLSSPGRQLQCRRPVRAQVDVHRAPNGGGLGAMPAKVVGLEVDQTWLVDLCRITVPAGHVQLIGARVQPGRQITTSHSAVRSSAEVVVEALAHRHPVDHSCPPRRKVPGRRDIELAVDQLGEEIQPDRVPAVRRTGR